MHGCLHHRGLHGVSYALLLTIPVRVPSRPMSRSGIVTEHRACIVYDGKKNFASAPYIKEMAVDCMFRSDPRIKYEHLVSKEEHVGLMNKFFDQVYIMGPFTLLPRSLRPALNKYDPAGSQGGQLWLHGPSRKVQQRRDSGLRQGPHPEEAPESDEPHDQD